MKDSEKNPIPLYAQIEIDMRHKIVSELWKVGDKIPTESQLCVKYSVSRITIRRAIENLVRKGLLYKDRPKGTYVKNWIQDDEKESFTIVKSFTKEMKELGKTAATMDVEIKIINSNKRLNHYLNLQENQKVLELKRTRGCENNIFAYFITYIPYKEEFSTFSQDYYGSIYKYLKQFDIVMNEQKEYIEAILPSSEVKNKLNIQTHQPVLKRVRMCKDTNSNFNEYTECYYNGEKYRYYLN